MFLVCTILLAVFLLAGILTAVYAPKIIEQQIRDNLKLKASLGKVSLSFPLTITLEKLEVENLASIKKISFSPNLLALLFGKVVIHGLNIIEPVINLEQSAEGKLNLPVFAKNEKGSAVYLTSLNLENGKIIFTDRKISPDAFQVVADKLNIKVSRVRLPITSLATNFSISAQLLNARGKFLGSLDFSGWLDYLAKDIDAALEVSSLDLADFSVYYGNFISNKKITRAMLDLKSTFKAKNNALKINTDFNLSQLTYAPTEEPLPEPDLMKNTLDLFCDPKGNLHLEFDIDTALDNPAISQQKLKSIILKAAMKNLANQPPQQIVDKVVDIIDKYKEYGKELKSIFGK